jgi:NAD(P)H-quinone oxidoreductase subunit 5
VSPGSTVSAVASDACLLGALLGPFVAAAGAMVSAVVRRHRTAPLSRLWTSLAWSGALFAVVLVARVALGGSFVLLAGRATDPPLFGVVADRLTVTLLGVVSIVGALVGSYARRYLAVDPSLRRFLAGANLVVGSMGLVSTAVSLPLLVGAWIGATVGFLVVLGCRPDLPGVVAASRVTRRNLAVGDLALLAGTVLFWREGGSLDLVGPGGRLVTTAPRGVAETLFAILVAVAALSRSAQGPLGRWLPSTVAAPTPASALLHAGLVNGGAILLLRLAPFVAHAPYVLLATFALAGVSAAVTATLMREQPTVKGRLAFSTLSQMGFLVCECAIGAELAALVHLIGHAFYKVGLFFGSGAHIPRPGSRPIRPAAPPIVARAALTAVATGSSLFVMAATFSGFHASPAPVLDGFVAVSLASGAWAWSGRCPPGRTPLLFFLLALLMAAGLDGVAIGALGAWVGPSLPTVATPLLRPSLLAGVAALALALSLGSRRPAVRRRLLGLFVAAGRGPVMVAAPDRDPRQLRPEVTLPLATRRDEDAA